MEIFGIFKYEFLIIIILFSTLAFYVISQLAYKAYIIQMIPIINANVKAKKYDIAYNQINRFNLKNSKNIYIKKLYADIYKGRKNYQEALKIYESLLNRSSQLLSIDLTIEIHRELIEIYQTLNMKSDILLELLDMYNKNIANADDIFQIGTLYKEKQEYIKAIFFLKIACKLKPISKYFYEIGCIYELVNRLNDAILSFEQVIAMNPKHLESYLSMANCYDKKNELINKLQVYQNYAKIDFSDEKILLEVITILSQLGRYSETIEQYNYFYQKNAQRPINTDSDIKKNIYFLVGNAYESTNKIILAVKFWEKALLEDSSFIPAKNRIELNKSVKLKHIEKFLTSTDKRFLEICKIYAQKMNLSILKIIHKNSKQIICICSKINNQNKSSYILFGLNRSIQEIDLKEINLYLDHMKLNKCHECRIITYKKINSFVEKYIENRPIEFYLIEEFPFEVSDLKTK